MSRLPFILAVALVSTLPPAIAFASPVDAPVKLSVRSVDFSDTRQVKAFYNHVQVAAQAACNSETLTPQGVREDRECRAQFVNEAVNLVNAPLLTAMNTNSDAPKTTAYAFGDQ